MEHKVHGSITVFLSLILVMVLALIGTLLDVARVDMAGSFAYRSLVSAVDTEFTKYCEELYEDYHIYMLGNGHNLSDVSGEEFINSVSEYLMYSFDADTNQNVLDTQLTVKGMDFLDLSLDSCKVDSTTSLADYDAKIFQDQVAQYMKYYVASEAAEGLLTKLNLMQQSGETMTVVRKKNEVDEAVAKIDKNIMKLMQEVEGITLKNNSIVVTDDYKLKPKESFAKKFCIGTPSPKNVGINKNVVWDSLKGNYIDVMAELTTIQNDTKTYIENKTKIEELKDKLEELEDEPEPTSTPEPTNENEEDSSQIPEEEEEKDEETEEEIEEIKKQIEDLGDENTEFVKEATQKAVNIRDLATDIEKNTVSAIGYIDDITGARDDCLPLLSEFEGTLSSYKDKLDSDTYDGISEEYGETKDYVQNLDENGCDTSVVGNIAAMKETLMTNQEILEDTQEVFRYVTEYKMDGLVNNIDKIDSLVSEYDNYSIKSLQFNYSDLEIKEKTENQLDIFSKLVDVSLLELVMDDTSSLSTATLDSSDLVSTNCCKDENTSNQVQQGGKSADEENNEELAGKLKEQDSDEGSGIGENLEVYEEQCQSATTDTGGVNSFTRKVLINEYGVTNYINLLDDLNVAKESSQTESKKTETEEESTTKKKVNLSKEETTKEETEEDSEGMQEETSNEGKATVLKYEQEYLAIGSYNDLDNVKSIVMRTLFVKMATNYISLLSNASCRKQARGAAISIVGFTGFAPLITITQHLILIAWGFEEALVDVRALLDGNEIPLIKDAKNFSIKFNELMSISKETIKKKAEAYSEGSNTLFSLSYNDFLRIYMLMVPSDTLSYRMLDLIQENMRLRYDDQFTILNGIFGTEVSMSVYVPSKFLTIPFIKTFTGYGGSNTLLKVETEYSY